MGTVGLVLFHRGAWSTRDAGSAPQGDESHTVLPGDDVGSRGGLILAGCQVPTKAALSLSLLNWTGGENKTKGS